MAEGGARFPGPGVTRLMPRRRFLPAGLALATAVVWLAMGCTERGSTPTGPWAPGDGADSGDGWTRVYPPVTCQAITDVWALESDDVWAVGDRGFALHHDGDRVEAHEVAADEALVAVAGLGHADVWAVSRDEVWRWDGLAWSEVPAPAGDVTFWDLACTATGGVWLAGERRRAVVVGDAYEWRNTPSVWRRAADGWQEYLLSDAEGEVTCLWEPHADGAVLAAVRDTSDTVVALGPTGWETLAWDVDRILTAAGPLVVAASGSPSLNSTYTIGPDLGLDLVCEGVAGEIIGLSRTILYASATSVARLAGCQRIAVLSDPRAELRCLAIPERPGPASPAVFVGGGAGLLLRGGWRDDGTLDWQELLPGPSDPVSRFVCDGERLYLTDGQVIVVGAAGAWVREEPPLPVSDLVLGADGAVYAFSGGRYGTGQVARREPDGGWTVSAMCPGQLSEIGVDAQGVVHAVSEDERTIWRLQADEWHRVETPGGRIFRFAVAPDGTLHAMIQTDELGEFLIHHDGTRWHVASGPDRWGISGSFVVGRGTGRVHARFRLYEEGQGIFSSLGTYADGAWTFEILGSDEPDYGFFEARDGTLYGWDWRALYVHAPDGPGWTPVLEAEPTLRDVWVDPDLGVFTRDDGELHHHPLPPR